MLNHEKLLKALNEDPEACQKSAQFNAPDEDQRNAVEFSALTTHLMWAESVGNDQTELERIVHSLETNPFLRRYQRWGLRSR